MTRAGEIKAAAKEETDTPYEEFFFRLGARWADEHPHWISVKDVNIKPTQGKYYLIVDSIGLVDYALASNCGWYRGGHLIGGVSHWMPLPKSPKGGK
jgi:hypothetical protein